MDKYGSIIWSLKASETFKGTYGEWGIAESLIIDGDKLYFTPGGPETTTIALNKNKGEQIWKSETIDDSPAYVSPILIDHSGKKLIVNVSLRYVFAVDASNGVIVWKIRHIDALNTDKSTTIWPDAPLIKCVTPLYHEGRIYVTGGYDHGGLMLNLIDSGRNVSVAWKDTVLDVHRGYVGLVRPDPEKFNLISSFKVPHGSGPHWAHPVINNGFLYIRHGKALMVYDIKDKST